MAFAKIKKGKGPKLPLAFSQRKLSSTKS